MDKGRLPYNMYERCSVKTRRKNTAWTERAHFAGDINRASDLEYNICAFVGQASAALSEISIKMGIARAINAAGAITNVKMVILSAHIPADMPEESLKEVIRCADSCCETENITLALGDICVTNVAEPLFTFTAIAIEKPICIVPKAGDSIIMAGTVGNSGVGALLELKKEELSGHFSKRFLAGAAKKTEDWLIGYIAGIVGDVDMGDICYRINIMPVAEGGLMAALWDLKSGYNVGFNVDLRAVPILQETVEICEYLEVNPYRLASDGAMLIYTSEPESILKACKEKKIPAACIGEITEGSAGNIKKDDEISSVSRPEMDEIYKFI